MGKKWPRFVGKKWRVWRRHVASRVLHSKRNSHHPVKTREHSPTYSTRQHNATIKTASSHIHSSSASTATATMASQNSRHQNRPSLYPTFGISDLARNLFPNPNHDSPPSAPPSPVEESLITIPGAILHLIDPDHSLPLASGTFSLLRLRHGPTLLALLARIQDSSDSTNVVQWPLTKDETSAVKIDDSHYFFSLPPEEGESESETLNYGLTFAAKGQEKLLKELDGLLGNYCVFSVQRVVVEKGGGVLDGSVAKETRPEEVMKEKKTREVMAERSGAYWTTLAPNVEEYSGTAARLIAAGSGKMVQGILWCGDVTVERLRWGNEVLMKRIAEGKKDTAVSPQTMKRIKRAKRVTKMTEKVANGVLSGVLKVSGFFTSSVANSKIGKKFFNLLPGEIVLASLDGFNKICDAAEVAGKNIMSTSSTVTTGLVTHRYGEDAGKATNEGLDAAGHAIGIAWAAFKLRKALNAKGALKSSSLAKSAAKAAAAEYKSKKSSK
ncbi:hypothetical protein Droror1_Dr00005195 [Drosera rotundifolia]